MKNKFIEKISQIYTPEDLKIVLHGLETIKRPVTFRVNTMRSNATEIETALTENNISYQKIDIFSGIYRLEADMTERSLWDLEIYISGKIYLQSFSSQLPVHFFAKNDDKINTKAKNINETLIIFFAKSTIKYFSKVFIIY